MSYFSNKPKSLKVNGSELVIVEWDELSSYLKREVMDIQTEDGCLHITCKTYPDDIEADNILEEIRTRD